jgi:Tfp pilus assembly protein PilF
VVVRARADRPVTPADAPAALESNLSRRPAAPAPAAPARRAAAGGAEAETQADARQTIVVTGSRVQRSDYNSTTPITTVDEATLDAAGDWNACTLADPDRDLDACRALADPAGRGAKGRAGAHLADGLTFAWQGDLDRAIAAFDRAIDAAPGLSIAYLNRALAYQQKGDIRRALADFDRAIAKDPRDGRPFYHRSKLQRDRGNTKRAEEDARRAIQLGGN